MKLEVILSCMHQKNLDIVQKTNISSDALVINQCDYDGYDEYLGSNNNKLRMISTRERGLSRSRNMALYNSHGDICLICDDDETLVDNYESLILDAFRDLPDADIISFKVNHPLKHRYPNKIKKIGYIGALTISSWQIAFRRTSIVDKHICFDVLMGSGTGNGGGEENKFLFDCLKCGLKIWYVPIHIGYVRQEESQWFFGFTPNFMRDKGWTSRRIMGFFVGYLYILLFVFRKYTMYKHSCSFFRAIKEVHIGFFERRITSKCKQSNGY